MIGQHEATLGKGLDTLQQLTASMNQLSSGFEAVLSQGAASATSPVAPPPAAAAPATTPPTTSGLQPCEPYISVPARYSGDLGTCPQFLFQCSLVFNQQPAIYPTDSSKVAFVFQQNGQHLGFWP